MNNTELLEICTDDRFRFMQKIPLSKKYNIDLVTKMVMMLCQSFGRKDVVSYLFVDEVRNRSMAGNLHNTMNRCPYEFRVINFRDRKSEYRHVKIGVIKTLVLLIMTLFGHMGIYLAGLVMKSDWINRRSSALLVRLFQSYLKCIADGKAQKIYCMSDHNFYSTVACVFPGFESYVLQHGLVMDMTYYYPVLADHFLAWGERSRKLMKDDPKVDVVGTYKFAEIKPNVSKNSGTMLYCVSITNMDIVGDKIEDLLKIAKVNSMNLKVKMHPGSFYHMDILETRFKGADIEYFKECDVGDIDFDVAIIENSTIMVDLMFLHKPVVIFDRKAEGYFLEYKDEFPWAENIGELQNALDKALSKDFNEIRKKIMNQELHNGRCSIWPSTENIF